MALKKRDALALVGCALVVLISFSPDHAFRGAMLDSASYSVRPSFSIPIDTSFFRNRHFPAEDELLPPPTVADLNGDGSFELIVATADLKIRVYAPSSGNVPRPSSPSMLARATSNVADILPDLVAKYKASTVPSYGVEHGRYPVAMASGYIDKREHNVRRPQYTVVVTNGWNVMMFDEEMRLKWETTIDTELFRRDLYQREAAVLVAPIPVRVGDDGVVIVSIRVAQREEVLYADRMIHEHHEQLVSTTDDADALLEEVKRRARAGKNNMELISDDEDTKENLEHFSMYAFAGDTGALRWKHEPGDFEGGNSLGHESHDLTNFVPEHTYKLHVFREDLHSGEISWTNYKSHILPLLPHAWHSRHDNDLKIAHFERERAYGRGGSSTARTSPQSPSSASLLLSNVHSSLLHAAGVPISSQGEPHSELEHIEKPNVIVAHTERGLEVVHLHTGRPLCELELPNRKGAYADVNGDGVLDHIYTTVKKRDERKVCRAHGISGVPPVHTLFATEICEPHGLELVSLRRKKNPSRIDTGAQAFLDRKPYSQWSAGMDSLFLVSTGDVTSIDPSGARNWRASTTSTWEPTRSKLRESTFLESSFRPTLQPIAMEVFGEERHVIAVGRENINIISQDGYVVGTTTVCGGVPLGARVVQGDFNDDGVNDFVVMTSNSVCGYRVERHTSSILFPVVAVLFVVLIIALSVNQTEESPRRKPKRKFDHASNTHID